MQWMFMIFMGRYSLGVRCLIVGPLTARVRVIGRGLNALIMHKKLPKINQLIIIVTITIIILSRLYSCEVHFGFAVKPALKTTL